MKTSLIICTFNEENTIADVLASCCRFNPEMEVIVVDDGSTDNTKNILRNLSRDYSFRYIRMEENHGKSWAMAHGVEISKNEVILFFDADVSNIKKEHFELLILPLMNGSADMVLGQPSETMIDYRINPFRSLTGERAVFKKDIVPILDEIRSTRFGIETFLNLYYQAQGKKLKYVLLKDLKHPSTFEKSRSYFYSTRKYLNEGREIAQTIIKNQDLIHQRIELLISKANIDAKKKLDLLQQDINTKLQSFKDNWDL